eukprot:1153799-Pelagomonas_calceolata.AAC.10
MPTQMRYGKHDESDGAAPSLFSLHAYGKMPTQTRESKHDALYGGVPSSLFALHTYGVIQRQAAT